MTAKFRSCGVHFLGRVYSFVERLRWISKLSGGTVSAAVVLFRIRSNPAELQEIHWNDIPIRFRGGDAQALKEVLVDQEYAFLADYLSGLSSPVILDVGAHIGTFALWVYSVVPNARIISAEADPRTWGVLQRNVAATSLKFAGWTAIHAAAHATDGETILLSEDGPSMSHRVSAEGTLAVPSISLEALLEKAAPGGGLADLVKIDIEGSEEALLCVRPNLLKRVKALVIELHPGLCDINRVHTTLKTYFDCIEEIGGRRSSKPLLFCRHGRTTTNA